MHKNIFISFIVLHVKLWMCIQTFVVIKIKNETAWGGGGDPIKEVSLNTTEDL